MSTTTHPPTTMTGSHAPVLAARIRAAIAARDQGIAAAEDGDRDGWDRALIDQAIDAFADQGSPFSANDLRDLLPEVRPALIGARFMHASKNRRTIRFVGWVTSTKASTHAKPVGLWRGAHTTFGHPYELL